MKKTLYRVALTPSVVPRFIRKRILDSFKLRGLSEYLKRVEFQEGYQLKLEGPYRYLGYASKAQAEIYRDTHHCLCLYPTYKGKFYNLEIAVLGFEVEEDFKFVGENSVIVKQIQGACRKKSSGFFSPAEVRDKLELPDKWERSLLETMILFSRDIGFYEINILPAERNDWYPSLKKGLRYNLKLRYDVTAKKRGFCYDEHTKLWKLSLN